MDSRDPQGKGDGRPARTPDGRADGATFAVARVRRSRRFPPVAIAGLGVAGVLIVSGLLAALRPEPEPSAPAPTRAVVASIGATPWPSAPLQTPQAWVWAEVPYDFLGPLPATVSAIWSVDGGLLAVVEEERVAGQVPFNHLAESRDGSAWAPVDAPEIDVHVAAAAGGQLMLLGAVSGSEGGHLGGLRTRDGQAWDVLGELDGVPAPPARVTHLAAGPTGWVAVVATPALGQNSQLERARLWYSADGLRWRYVDLPGLDAGGRIIGVAGSGDRWVLVERREGPIDGTITTAFTSADGITWSTTTVAELLGNVTAIASRDEGFVIVGDREGTSSRLGVWLTDDGAHWALESPIDPGWPLVPFGPTAVAPWRDGWVVATLSGDLAVTAGEDRWHVRHVLPSGDVGWVQSIVTIDDVVIAGGASFDGEPRFWTGSLAPFLP